MKNSRHGTLPELPQQQQQQQMPFDASHPQRSGEVNTYSSGHAKSPAIKFKTSTNLGLSAVLSAVAQEIKLHKQKVTSEKKGTSQKKRGFMKYSETFPQAPVLVPK